MWPSPLCVHSMHECTNCRWYHQSSCPTLKDRGETSAMPKSLDAHKTYIHSVNAFLNIHADYLAKYSRPFTSLPTVNIIYPCYEHIVLLFLTSCNVCSGALVVTGQIAQMFVVDQADALWTACLCLLWKMKQCLKLVAYWLCSVPRLFKACLLHKAHLLIDMLTKTLYKRFQMQP